MTLTGPIATADTPALTEHSSLFGLHRTLVGLLHARGYDSTEAIELFLNPRLADLHSPFLLRGMRDAVARIRSALDARERIGIFADSDLDGITSLAVMHNLFSRMGISPFIRYLRGDENYGITRDMIDEYHAEGVILLITVDSGTRDVNEISYARSLGIDVIVTDHHEPERELPDAVIINPKIEGSAYPFRPLAGVGVAFKLCHAILMSYLPSFNREFLLLCPGGAGYERAVIRDGIILAKHPPSPLEDVLSVVRSFDESGIIIVPQDDGFEGEILAAAGKRKTLGYADFVSSVLGKRVSTTEEICSLTGILPELNGGNSGAMIRIFLEVQMMGSPKIIDYIDTVMGLVSIGSVADVVPLVGENRLMVRHGIHLLNRRRHRAIDMLNGNGPISARTIAWSIGPLLNTPGRLGKTELAVKFFLEADRRSLRTVIDEIRDLNEERKGLVSATCERIMQSIRDGSITDSGRMIFIRTEEIQDGFAGLVANRISDMTGKPVIVAVFPGKDGLIKGSGRSRSGTIFFTHIERFRERFERLGGHENAFGFTVPAGDIDAVMRMLEESMSDEPVPEEPHRETIEIPLGDISVPFINDLQRLEPFGNGNDEPLFIARGCRFLQFRMFGNNHGKYLIEEGNPLTVVGWRMGGRMKDCFETGRPLDVVFRLENNDYNGTVSPRMIAVDIRVSD